jgi:hypothetical protein
MSPKAIGPLAGAALLILIVSADRVSAQGAAAQAGSPGLVLLPYPEVPARELAFSLSEWDLSGAAGTAGGATYTRNLDDSFGLEGGLDVGANHSRPFAVAIAQIRASRVDPLGIRQFMTVGVARVFANRDRLDVPEGRALAAGGGLQIVVRDSALRLGIQVLLFERALATRVTCAFVKGFD